MSCLGRRGLGLIQISDNQPDVNLTGVARSTQSTHTQLGFDRMSRKLRTSTHTTQNPKLEF